MWEAYYWYWFCNIPGVTRACMHKLLEKFGSPEGVYHASEEIVLSYLSSNKAKISFIESKKEEIIWNGLEHLKREHISFLYPACEEYPSRLKRISDAPLGLYLKGRLPSEKGKSLAIIGARDCTRYGKEMARFFGRELAKCGIQIISGLARGIDGMSHRGALEGKGYTLGILGGGIDRVYPKENYDLFMEMEHVGGILSESNLGIAPHAGLFPQRNRLISGMADGILVVEAKEKSGTFITVDQGLDQGKEIFVIPGRIIDPQSAGCNNLIKLGAHVVTEVADIIDVLKVDDCDVSNLPEIGSLLFKEKKNLLAPIEKIVYSCLDIEPKYLEDVVSEVHLAPQDVCMALNHLVTKNFVVETSRNYYAISVEKNRN